MTRPADCGELERAGLVDAGDCCEVCHSAERYASRGSFAPCRVRLPNGLPNGVEAFSAAA